MQDTFQWTDDLAFEFASRYPLLTVANKKAIIEAFKANNSPKKEWEVVAFKHRGEIAALIEDWKEARCYSQPHFEYPGQQMSLAWALDPANNCTIHSVRRLSDNTKWSLKERVEVWDQGMFFIEAFEIRGNKILVKTTNAIFHIDALQKLPQPILTTVDGVGIFEMEHFWCLKHGFPDMLNPYTACEQTPEWFAAEKGYQIFSTKDAMNNWLAENKPLLSLNDVKNYVKAGESASFAIEKLTALVKQKLNQ